MKTPAKFLCPSAPPFFDSAVAIGVSQGTEGERRVAYLRNPIPADELIRTLDSHEQIGRFRFAAECQSRCLHFNEQRCALVDQIVKILPAEVTPLPECGIRPSCRWFEQRGREACFRCPQIEWQVPLASPQMQEAVLIKQPKGNLT